MCYFTSPLLWRDSNLISSDATYCQQNYQNISWNGSSKRRRKGQNGQEDPEKRKEGSVLSWNKGIHTLRLVLGEIGFELSICIYAWLCLSASCDFENLRSFKHIFSHHIISQVRKISRQSGCLLIFHCSHESIYQWIEICLNLIQKVSTHVCRGTCFDFVLTVKYLPFA